MAQVYLAPRKVSAVATVLLAARHQLVEPAMRSVSASASEMVQECSE